MSTWIGTVSTDWNNVLNWGPGGTGAGIPSATVDAIFSGTPVNACVLNGNRACRALTFTGYTSTVDLATFTLSASGNITFQADQSSRVLGTTGRLISVTSHTITSNAGTWPLDYQITNLGLTITISGDMRIAGSWVSSGGGTQTLIGAFNIYVGTNVTMAGTLSSVATNIIMNGSGTYSGNGTTNLEINTTGTVVVTGTVNFTRRFIVAVTGTVTMTAANVTINNTTTIDVNGKTVGNLTHGFSATSTVTYLTDVYCSNFSIGNGTNIYNGPGQIYASGNYVFGGASSGSLIVNLIGTGTIGVGTMGLSCVIAATGTYTLGVTLTLGTSISFTSATGAVLNTGISTVTVSNGVTISTLGLSWNNITISASATITINSLFYIVGTLAITSGTTTFSGTAGWNCGTLTCSTASTIIVLQSGVTYTTTVNAVMLGTNAGRITMRSNAPTVSYAIWTLQNPATQSMVYVNAQGINSNAGMTIYSFQGVILTSLPALNWFNGASQGTKAFTFVN
jgi:hypothetical protein